MANRIPTFNLSELDAVYMGMNRYRINANERLEDKIIVFGYLEPFELVGEDKYINPDGTKLFII